MYKPQSGLSEVIIVALRSGGSRWLHICKILARAHPLQGGVSTSEQLLQNAYLPLYGALLFSPVNAH